MYVVSADARYTARTQGREAAENQIGYWGYVTIGGPRWEAYLAALSVKPDCPYDRRTVLGREWLRGWSDYVANQN